MRPATYARVSSEEQAASQTILTQLDFARRYCDLHGLGEPLIYQDDGVSGVLPLHVRPGGARLLEDARAGKLKVLYLYRLDRLGRDTRVILAAVEALEAAGCVVKSMTEPFDTESPTGRFTLTILSGVATLEKEVIVERCMDGKIRRAREGQWGGGPAPYGYRVEGGHLQPHTEPIPGLELSEADVVRLIYARMVAGGAAGSIAEHLNALGVPTAYVRDGKMARLVRGGKTARGLWYTARVCAILTNPVYAGTLHYGRKPRSARPRPVVEASVPALVSLELWQQAQEQLRSHRRFARHPESPYLLRGLLFCGRCGRRYLGISARHSYGTYRYYVCAAGRPSGGVPVECHGAPRLVAGEVEAQAWETLLRWVANPAAVAQIHAEAQAPGALEAARADLAALCRRVEGKALERERLISLYRRGLVDDQEVETQLRALAAETDALALQQAEAKRHLRTQEPQPPQPRAACWEEIAAGAEAADGNPPAMRRLLALALERVTVTGEGRAWSLRYSWRP